MKHLAHDTRALKKALPLLGEWVHNYFMGKPNEVFRINQIPGFIKKGIINNEEWKCSKAVGFKNGKLISEVCMDIRVRVRHSLPPTNSEIMEILNDGD